ncbi:cytoplasmic protein [Oscillatoria nigro-viridis]
MRSNQMAEYAGCRGCRHYLRVYINGIPTCRAFPEGIPPIIIVGKEHTKPLPDQDNTIVYEPAEAAK